METFYGRHTAGLNVDAITKQELYDQNLIAIHYPEDKTQIWPNDWRDWPQDSQSISPADYRKKAKEIMSTMANLGRDGGYVCVEYPNQHSTKVGIVLANTPIKLRSGKYLGMDRVATLKTLQITEVRELTAWVATRMLVGRPQRHTLCRWNIGDRIEHLVRGTEAVRRVSDLLPNEQEILCSEFLRLDLAETIKLPRLVTLVTPIGRTMKDLDIIGLTSTGLILVAQVTHGRPSDAPEKLDKLRKYASVPNCLPIFFCNCDDNYVDGEVRIVSLRHVFEQFVALNIGRMWLQSLSAPP